MRAGASLKIRQMRIGRKSEVPRETLNMTVHAIVVALLARTTNRVCHRRMGILCMRMLRVNSMDQRDLTTEHQ